MPEVSVLIPVYNGSAFVETALRSALTQEGVDFEVIVGDNASTDDTLDIVAHYSGDARLRVLTSEQNLGIFGNLNRLVQAADARYIKILCADDYFLPGGLRRQLQFMKENPSVGLARCQSQLDRRARQGKGSQRWEHELPSVIPAEAAILAFYAFGNLPGNLTHVICTKAALQAAGKFDQRFPYAGDFEMWGRVACLHGLGLHREECVHVTEHIGQSSVTLNRNNELVGQIDRILDELHDRLPADMRRLGRFHSTLNYGVHHASNTLHRLKEGKWGAWRALFGPRHYAYGGLVCLFFYFLTGGGRWGLAYTTRIFLRRICAVSAPFGNIRPAN